MKDFDCFRAIIRYHRTDDLKEGALEDGAEILVQAYPSEHPNEFNFFPSRCAHWMPEKDLEIISSVSIEEYKEDQKQCHESN